LEINLTATSNFSAINQNMLLTFNDFSHPNLTRCPSPELEVSTNEKNQTQPARHQRKNVSFYEIVAIKAHDHFQDMTPEEIFAAWYKKHCYTAMKQDCITAVRLIMKGDYPGDNDVLCQRGLECRTQEGSMRRKINKVSALRAVLIAQQKFNGDAECIRTEYTKVCEAHRLDALKMGYNDAQEAVAIYRSDFQKLCAKHVEDEERIGLRSSS
jgi:hypothetical protein